MEDIELNLLLKYPLLSKTIEGNAVVYRGSVEVNDEDYKIIITKSENDTFKLFLPEKLRSFETELNAVFNDVDLKNVVIALDNICLILSSKISPNKPVNHCAGYKHVIYEYLELTRFYMNLKSSYLAHDLSKIQISTVDEQKREHLVEIAINFDDDKDIFQIKTYDLPQDKKFFKSSQNLRSLYEQFLGVIEMLQPFFDLMDTFDKNCWVLDPIEPKRNCNYRRIKMGENLSVIITVDPFNVSRIPVIKFLGPEKLVNEHRSTVNENLANWDLHSSDICSEILKLLGMDYFPPKSAQVGPCIDILKEIGDCSICFSLRLNEKLPEVICKNKSCDNHYHTECLYEWLMSVNARRFFTEVIGQCPNCEKNISCPIPNT